MDWFDQLRDVLVDYYPTSAPRDIVGYLKGSSDAKTWRKMATSRTEQMLVLGSSPPTDAQWEAAGVKDRTGVQTIRRNDLDGFMITYGGLVSGRPWGKISVLSVELFRGYGITITQFKAAVSKASTKKTKLVTAMSEAIDKLQREFDNVSGEHKLQAGVITGSQGFVSGVFGYWTNHLFNKDVPPQAIWNECFGQLAHARSTLREGKLTESAKTILQARSSLLKASGIYYRWKGGIVGAGQKMETAIELVAAAAILAFLLAPEIAEANEVEKAVSILEKADDVLVRVVTTSEGGVTAPSVVAYEQMLEEASEDVVEMMRMIAG